MTDIRHIAALDVVATALMEQFRKSLGPKCAVCVHEIKEPFHGCGIGKQRSFAAGGEDCQRFETQSGQKLRTLLSDANPEGSE